jgi:hypothetical protein
MKKIILILILSATLGSCRFFRRENREDAVARVYDHYLYKADLAGIVPKGSKAKDSLEITKTFINNWIRQTLLLHQAQSNLTEEQQDFAKQLEDYHNSLVIYEYESKLIRQKLDTVVSNKEVEDYYAANQANFELRENIVQVNYVTLSNNSPLINKFRTLLKSDRPADREKLEDLCQASAASSSLDNENWLPFNDLVKRVPLTVSDQVSFLESNKFIELQDSIYRYLVRIKSFKTKESVSPLSFETGNIRSIILNKRKLELVSRMQEDIFQEAMKKKNFELY